MYALYGEIEHVTQTKIGGPFETSYEEELVALFTTFQKAIRYVEGSRLKQPKGGGFSGEVRFKDSSLLAGCCDCEIRDYSPEPDPPIDPGLPR